MAYLQTAAGPIFYAHRGNASPVLLCVHGAGADHTHWGAQLRDLCKLCRVITIDLPGHGRSPGAGKETIAEYGEVVLAVLDALGLEQVVLAGHSMGGAITLWLALHAPERLQRIVLVGTGARLKVAEDILQALQDDPASAVDKIVDMSYDVDTEEALRQMGRTAFSEADPMFFYRDLQACDAFDVRPQVAQIACSALVICGESDRMIPPKFSQFLAEQVPHAELVLVPHAGHMVQIEQPDMVGQAIAHWLRDGG
jgi:pimeloyl-ACP methyl ester carboxylesterase